jgi:hypothetical protein
MVQSGMGKKRDANRDWLAEHLTGVRQVSVVGGAEDSWLEFTMHRSEAHRHKAINDQTGRLDLLETRLMHHISGAFPNTAPPTLKSALLEEGDQVKFTVRVSPKVATQLGKIQAKRQEPDKVLEK